MMSIVQHNGARLVGDANVAHRPEFNAHAGGIYVEICISRGEFSPVVFPDTCPACGAPVTNTRDGQTEFARIEYACLGRYEHKPQIQGHTSKWWGRCPRRVVGAALDWSCT